MEIKEKYRSYGSSSHAESPSFKATLLTIAAIAAIGLLVFVFVTVHPVHDVGSLLLLLMLYVAAICFFVNYVSRAKDSGFVADDASVTFTRKFAKDITIPYIDIDTVAVYTERKSGNSTITHGRNTLTSCTVLTAVTEQIGGRGISHRFRCCDWSGESRDTAHDIIDARRKSLYRELRKVKKQIVEIEKGGG